jgi:hypothetical protein
VSTTVQLNGEVKRHRKCKSCSETFITLESVIEKLPVGRPAKQTPVPDERGLFTRADANAIKMQRVLVRRENEDKRQ